MLSVVLFTGVGAPTSTHAATNEDSGNVIELKKMNAVNVSAFNQLVIEVNAGIITTDEEAYARLAELNHLPQPITVNSSSSGGYPDFNDAAYIAKVIWAVGPIDAAKVSTAAEDAIEAAENSGFTGAHNGPAATMSPPT